LLSGLPYTKALFVSFVIFVLFGGIVAIGWHGANLVQANELQPGELFSFVFYTAIIGFSIAGLGDIYAQLQRAIGASERVLDILEMEDEAEAVEDHRLQLSGEITFLTDVSFLISFPYMIFPS
jgi:ATP-binding cassette subfamily B protein